MILILVSVLVNYINPDMLLFKCIYISYKFIFISSGFPKDKD